MYLNPVRVLPASVGGFLVAGSLSQGVALAVVATLLLLVVVLVVVRKRSIGRDRDPR